MNQEYYDNIKKELEKLGQKQLQNERMNIICAGNNTTQNVTKNAILKNIYKYDVYYCKSYVQSKFKAPPTKEQKRKISKTLKGRKLSQETKNKISLASIENETIKNVIGKRYFDIGKPNPRLGTNTPQKTIDKIKKANTGKIRTLEMKQKYSEAKKKFYKDQSGMKEETKEKLSQIMADKIQSGEFNPFGNCRKIRHTSSKCKNSYNTVKLKSSYEKTACLLLDNDSDCISYTYEPIQIKYVSSKGSNHIYIPDFIATYSNNEIKILEIKPIRLMKVIPDNLLKQEAVIEYCEEAGYTYEFWNEITMNIEGQAYIQYDESYYDTYEEFKEATRALGIKSSTEYKKKYKMDSRLPSHPSYVYPMFNSWYDALNKRGGEFYSTYEEASTAARKLNIKNKTEYYERYKEDAKLHCAPEEKYKDKGWINYYDFLGTNREYYSYEEAKAIIKQMGLTKVHEYKQKYRNDKMLPSKPERIYKEQWNGWKKFLGE